MPPVAAAPPLLPCCAGFGEHFDGCPLVAKVTDRWGSRYQSPLGDCRDHAIRCVCGQPTLALDGRCDRCALLEHLDEWARQALLGASPTSISTKGQT